MGHDATSVVHPNAKIGRGTWIGPMCEIGPAAEIGDGCRLVGCTVEGKIGDRTKVWRYAHVMEGAVVGNDCQVCNGAIILTDAVVGNRCDIQLFAGVARKCVVEDDVFIGPGTIFCNAKKPSRRVTHSDLEGVVVRRGASVGANCSLLPGVEIGEDAIIGAGTVVTKNVPAGTTLIGDKLIMA